MTSEQAHHRALLSLLDCVEELALGLAHGQTPDPEWAEIVERTFEQHRDEIRDPEAHEAGEVSQWVR